MFKKILVVCTGNICRSPIAEGLFRAKLQGRSVECLSAGTYAMVGNGADANAVEVMAEHGHDISMHRAQQATSQLLADADLVLALDQTHVDWLMQKTPHLRGRIFKLGKWNGNADVPDPYRRPRAAFVESRVMIEAMVDAWIKIPGMLN